MSTCCGSGMDVDDPRDRARSSSRLRGCARRQRGRHLQPGAARGQHRGAAGRHPGLDRPRRLRPDDERDRHAGRAHRARRRQAARRPERRSSRRSPRRRSSRSRRRSRPRPRSSARTASRSRPRRRGRRGRGARPRTSAPTPTRAEALLLHTGRLADRRARQPRARYARQPAQRRLPRRRGAGRALGPPKPKKKFAGELTRGPHRPRRPARRDPAPADLHERVRPLGRARRAAPTSSTSTGSSSSTTRSTSRSATIRVRLGGGLAGHNGLKSLKRDLGSPTSIASASASAGPTPPTRTSSPPTCSAAGASRPPRSTRWSTARPTRPSGSCVRLSGRPASRRVVMSRIAIARRSRWLWRARAAPGSAIPHLVSTASCGVIANADAGLRIPSDCSRARCSLRCAPSPARATR